jgi:hypothetical protein
MGFPKTPSSFNSARFLVAASDAFIVVETGIVSAPEAVVFVGMAGETTLVVKLDGMTIPGSLR